MCALRGLSQAGREIQVAFAVAFKAMGAQVRQVHVARKVLGVSERELLGDHVAAVGVLQRRYRCREIRARPVHLIYDEHVRHMHLIQ